MDKRELFKIGDVAKMFNLSVSLLRHYETLGLLSPEYVDPATGYRYYSTRQFEALNTIRYLRVLDTPLEQISDFLKNRDLDRMQELLSQQREAVAAKRRELETVERKIANRLNTLEDARNSRLDEIELRTVPARRIALIRRELAIGKDFDLELPIRQLEGQQSDAMIFLGKVGVGITRERLIKREYGRYGIVFLLLDPEDEYTGHVERVPTGTYAALRFQGSHAQAAAQYEKLMVYMDEQGLEPAGFSWEITMIDQGLTCDPLKFVTEIQIPVRSVQDSDNIKK